MTKKIVLIGPVYPYRGGIAHFTTILAQKLRQNEDQIEVISFKRQYPKFLYPGKSDQDPSKEAIKVEAQFLLDPLYPWTWFSAVRRMDQFGPDLVVFSWWTTFWAPAYSLMASNLKKKKIKVAYLVHNVLPHELRPWDPFVARLALRWGDHFIVQAESQQEILARLLPDAKISLCPHPVYSMFSDRKISQCDARKTLGLPDSVPVLLFFGIVRPYKGLQNLIDAMIAVHQRGIKAHLLVAGEFWLDPGPITHQIQEFRLEEYIHLYQRYIPNEEIGTFFSAADILVAPYLEGTQSGVAKIGLGFNLPMIVSQVIAQGDSLLKTNPNVVMVDMKDPDQLPDAIAAMIEQIKQDSRLMPSAHSASEDGWDEMIDTIYQCMLEK